jgi:hypothetical protein
MTYEPEQQVLVRGVVRSTSQQLADDRGWIRITIPSQDMLTADGEVKVLVAAADVVGPAPATPDEGAVEIERLNRETTARGRTITELLAKNSSLRSGWEIAQRRLENVLALHGQGDTLWCGTCRVDWPCPTVRALSVEAVGPEGGGGHE